MLPMDPRAPEISRQDMGCTRLVTHAPDLLTHPRWHRLASIVVKCDGTRSPHLLQYRHRLISPKPPNEIADPCERPSDDLLLDLLEDLVLNDHHLSVQGDSHLPCDWVVHRILGWSDCLSGEVLVSTVHCPAGGCHNSTLLPSGSMTHANLPYSDSSILSSTLQPSSFRTLTKAWRSSTR